MQTETINSQLPEGYKQTDVGIIPEDWNVSTVGNEFEIKLGKMLDAKKNVGTLKPYLGNKSVQWNRLDLSDLQMMAMTQDDLKRFRLRQGDLLVCEGGEVGRAAIWNSPIEECYYQKALHRLRPLRKFNTKLFLEFLHYWTDHEMLGNYVSQTSIAHLTREKFAEVPLPVPPIPEQQAIAEVLSDVDALITSLDQLINKKRNIKQGTMQLLLTGKKRLPGFSGDWETKTLGEICSSINDGTHHTPKYVEDGVPFYSVENVTANNFNNTKFITKQAHAIQIRRCKPEKGDILLTRIGTLGKTKLIDWDVDASIYVSLALLKVNSRVNANYLYAYTKSRQFVKDVENRSLLNAIPQKINMGDINNVPIQVPPTKEEQKAIAQILSDMDAEIEALETRRDKYKAVKQGMMQELLTGKTRLI